MNTLQTLVDYVVPLNLWVLMFVAGTEIRIQDFQALRRDPSPTVIGAIGQLAFLPLVSLAIVNSIDLDPTIALGAIILSLCPGGGISNTYCYLARSNVLLSAMIAVVGTVASLLTIPLWLQVLPTIDGSPNFGALPALTIIGQLLVIMIVPLGVGMLARHSKPRLVERVAPTLRRTSTVLIVAILLSALATVGPDLKMFSFDIFLAATLFIVSAMLLGALLAARMTSRDRPVIVIESAVRNISVALILGGALLEQGSFGLFATFLTGYFLVEIVIMLTFATLLAKQSGASLSP